VPKTGGVIEGVTVNIEPEMEWEARILAGSDPDGYLGTTPGTTTATGRGIDKLVAGFPKVYYPQVNVRREIKIEVNIKNSTGSKATLTVTQEPIVPKRMKVMNMRNDHYGSLTGSYFQYYQSYLRYSPLFGSINSKSPMVGGSEMTSLLIAPTNDPSEISTDYVYLHAGGQPGLSYSAKRHNAIYNWWKNFGKDEGILVYVNDEVSENLFQTEVFRDINVSFAGARGGNDISVKMSGDPRTASSPVYDYIMNKGPFGVVNGSMGGLDRTLWNDGTSSTAITTAAGSTAIPILWDGANKTIMFIDPANNVVFIGDGQMFDAYMHPATTLAGTNAGSYPNNSKFLGNLLAYIVNSAQYGSHFSDLFTDPDLYTKQKALSSWNNPY
jgi:hypothetical protein